MPAVVSLHNFVVRANATVASERELRTWGGSFAHGSRGKGRKVRERAVIHRRSGRGEEGRQGARGCRIRTVRRERCRRSLTRSCPPRRPSRPLDLSGAAARQLEHRRLDERRGEARLLVLLILRARLEILVGSTIGPHLQLAVVELAREREEVEHVVAEAADRSLLDRDEHLVVGGELQDQLGVQRLHEASVGDGDADLAVGRRLDHARRLDRRREPRAQRQDGDAASAGGRLASHGPCRRAPPCRWRGSRRDRIQSSR